jgi:hypothetical protein
MGKKRSQKDRAYITATEWREEHGGHRGRLQGAAGDFRRLPFNCCAISFQPFEDAVGVRWSVIPLDRVESEFYAGQYPSALTVPLYAV